MQTVDPPLKIRSLSVDSKNIGALAGIAYKSDTPEASADIYVLPQNQHWDAVEKWKSSKDISHLTISAGSNGSLLFIGFFDKNQEDAEDADYRIGDMSAAFNGEE